MTNKVWIVQHDESPHNTVLGVFASADEAHKFAEEVEHEWANGVLTAAYDVGYKYNAENYRFEQ